MSLGQAGWLHLQGRRACRMRLQGVRDLEQEARNNTEIDVHITGTYRKCKVHNVGANTHNWTSLSSIHQAFLSRRSSRERWAAGSVRDHRRMRGVSRCPDAMTLAPLSSVRRAGCTRSSMPWRPSRTQAQHLGSWQQMAWCSQQRRRSRQRSDACRLLAGHHVAANAALDMS